MTIHPDVSSIILGAGLSSRMGVEKLTLPWQGSTIIETVLNKLGLVGVGQIILVLRPSQKEVVSQLKDQSHAGLVRIVFLDQFFPQDMLASIQCGIASLSINFLYAMIFLGDQPLIQTGTLTQLMEARLSSDKPLIVPSFQMKRGHPWLVRRDLWSDLLESPHQNTPRAFLNAYENEIHYVPVNDESILKDIDTPEEYDALKD